MSPASSAPAQVGSESVRTVRICATVFLVIHGFSLLFSFTLPAALILNLILIVLAIVVLVSNNRNAAILLLIVVVCWGLFIAWSWIQAVQASGTATDDLGSVVLLAIEILVAITLVRATSRLSK